MVSIASLLLAEHENYRVFTRHLDELVAERAGRGLRHKVRDRAMQFYKAGRYIAALREFHDARRDWFAGDTIRGSLLSSILIARCYDNLYLHMAAKYYSLSVGVLALDLGDSSLRDLAGIGLLEAAQSDYSQGAWFGFLELAEIGFMAHQVFDRDAMDIEQHEILQSTLLSLTWSLVVARRLGRTALKAVEAVLDASGTRCDVEQIEGPEEKRSLQMVNDRLAQSIEEQVGASAFADAGAERTIQWKSLGIQWIVKFSNTYDVVRAAERFIAITQIVLADLADSELCLLPTSIEIHLSLADVHVDVHALPSNDGRRWNVVLTRHEATGVEAVKQTQTETLASVLMILREVSVLPDVQINDKMEQILSTGIFDKIFPNGVYDVLYRNCVPRSDLFNRHGLSVIHSSPVMKSRYPIIHNWNGIAVLVPVTRKRLHRGSW